MKSLNLFTVSALTMSALAMAAKPTQRFKTANDPCPKGTHEVIVTEEYKYQADKNSKDITTVKDTSKGCRDNKDSGIEERK